MDRRTKAISFNFWREGGGGAYPKYHASRSPPYASGSQAGWQIGGIFHEFPSVMMMPPGQMVIHRSGPSAPFPRTDGKRGHSRRSAAHCAKHASNWFRGVEKKSVTYTHDDAMGRVLPSFLLSHSLCNIVKMMAMMMMMKTTRRRGKTVDGVVCECD